MLQTPETAASAVGDRLKRLRRLMSERKLDAFLVPRADEHQGEYVAPSSERLRWLTGFSGSAGIAVVTRRAAALFVDGRYTVQAVHETDADAFEIRQVPEHKLSEWLTGQLRGGAVVGFDPWLHTIAEIEALEKALAPRGIGVKPSSRNPVDALWGKGRPASPAAPVVPHPLEFAGVPADEKIAALQKKLKADGQDAAVLTLPDSIAWLFNIRGSDVAHNPVALAFAIVPAGGKPALFIDPKKIGAAVRTHLSTLAKLQLAGGLAQHIKSLRTAGRRVRVDPDSAAYWFARALGSRSLMRAADPCRLPKARKNETEIKGARAAHRRDGLALVRFLAWLDRSASAGGIDELTAVAELERQRRASNLFRDVSFDTISGSGPNGAIVHYRVTPASNRPLKPGELFLLDSGGQYLDGTTDVTRTIAIGVPTEEMRQRFTAVLKAHISVATARFPKGTRGVEIDALARRQLWDLGLDYDHGTGHGVGSYLSVHEAPPSIGKRGMAALEPTMICSNEPGYYREGAYGIRIENLVLVTEPEPVVGGERPMMGFETLTLVPIDRRLIEAALLNTAELDWVDAYHARVRQQLASDLSPSDRAWLEAATAPLRS